MMRYYQELTIIPDADISPYFIWQKLYTQLHIALTDVRNKHGKDSIGVSFPNYRFEQRGEKTFATLGNKLRVFAPDETSLQLLNLPEWLARLNDYVHIKSISKVPDGAGHVVVKRYRHINKEKQAKAFAEFKGISFEEALVHCQKHKQGNVAYPYINLKSESNSHKYKLAIGQDIASSVQSGSFNTYGLNNTSGTVTVPHW